MWRLFKEAHATLLRALAPALGVADFLRHGRHIRRALRKQASTEERQMDALRKILRKKQN
jgi:hypothetical protein